jgi:hypothetical protein
MGRRSLIENIVLDPEQLALLREVFDAVWDEIAWDYDASAASTEVGRLRLANALLAAHQRGVSDTRELKAGARRRMVMWRHQLRIVRQPVISTSTTPFGGFGQPQARVVTPKIAGRKTDL